MPRVYSKRRPSEIPSDAVYIGRPSKWGNPFSKGSKSQNIEDFREYAEKRVCHDPQWLEPLRNKHLVCWCAPNPCHGDVIISLLEKGNDTDNDRDWDAWCVENEPEYPYDLGLMHDLNGNPERI